jgi:trimethyllysine dioxygenase
LEKIGPIRHTHYGGFYDFIPDMALADTAYTNLALPAHTDTTYFTEPARLQAFHMLSHETNGQEQATGGESLLVDGFRAATMLAQRNPANYEALATLEIPWHASGNEGISITPDTAFPVLERRAGHVFRVRWNNDDRGVVPLWAGIKAVDWYRAASQWNEILRLPSSECRFPLKPGSLLSKLLIWSISPPYCGHFC